MNALASLILLTAVLSSPALGESAARAVVYNNLAGDGGAELDRAIKAAYGDRYTVVDTSRSAGFVEPEPTAGELPGAAKNEWGQQIAGYVLVAYIVGIDGTASDRVVLRASDDRLTRVALEAMTHWRFTPATLKGVPVATTAAQEFRFGPVDVSNGYTMQRLGTYQPNDVLMKRMPPAESVNAYVSKLERVAHNFFVGAAVPETVHIVVAARPGRETRLWLVSSTRAGDSPALQPLMKLLEAVPGLEVHGGPVALALSGSIAGGDGKETLKGDAYRSPVPAEWLALNRSLPGPLPLYSDAFLNRLFPETR